MLSLYKKKINMYFYAENLSIRLEFPYTIYSQILFYTSRNNKLIKYYVYRKLCLLFCRKKYCM